MDCSVLLAKASSEVCMKEEVVSKVLPDVCIKEEVVVKEEKEVFYKMEVLDKVAEKGVEARSGVKEEG